MVKGLAFANPNKNVNGKVEENFTFPLGFLTFLMSDL